MGRSKSKRAKRSSDTPPTKQIAIRLPPDLIERIDAYGAHLQSKMIGVPITRTAAIKDLLERALRAKGI